MLAAYAFLLAGIVAVNLLLWRRQSRHMIQPEPGPPPPLPADPPLVSILVAAWNEAVTLGGHVASFHALDYPRRELVLCAGGDDGTYALARSLAGHDVVVLEQRPGEGQQAARRRCLQAAKGSIIFLTDADSLLSSEALQRTLAPLLSGEEQVVAGSLEPLPGQLRQAIVRHRYCIDAWTTARAGSYLSPAGINGVNLALTREGLEAAGGFENEVAAGTDYDLAVRLRSRGYRLRFLPESAIATEYAESAPAYLRRTAR